MRSFLASPSWPSRVALAILVVVGIAHLIDHWVAENLIRVLTAPLTPLICPEVSLSKGIRTASGASRYVAGVVLNAYLLAYLSFGMIQLGLAVRRRWRTRINASS